MPVFAYEALDGRQSLLRGTIAADTPALARQALRSRGLQIAALSSVRAPRAAWRRFRPRGAGEALAGLWQNLAVLLEAGVPLADALTLAHRQERGPLKVVLQELHEQVQAGTALSEALGRRPEWFDPLTRVVVRVGQNAGSLPLALRELADFQGRHRALVNRVSTALIYPAILVLVGTAVVAFLMTYVVPQLSQVLASAGRQLPLPTRMLQALSSGIVNFAPLLAVAGVLLVIAVLAARRTARGARLLERATLALPRLGDLLRKAWIARICTMLAALLRADVPFIEAVRTIAAGLPHRLYREELERLAVAVEAGRSVGDPLRDEKLFPPLVAHLLALGQTSGELPQMLDRLRGTYEAQVQIALARFLAVLEPALILVLAVIIGLVVYATLLPILETTKIVQ